MTAKVVCNGQDSCKVALDKGQSFIVKKEDLPASLRTGGDVQLVLVPAGEKADKDKSKELLNYLLRIE